MSENSAIGIDTRVFDRISQFGTTDQRLSLAGQLAAFVSDPDTPRPERDAVVPAMVTLATDPVVNVRHALANGLARTEPLNSDILFTIAADCDEVACDFLIKTPALDAWHMMAILKVGESSKQAAIATRGDLGEQVVEFIVEQAPAEVAAQLLENPCVAVSPAQCKQLYVRLTDEPVVVDRLLQRDDLPLEIRLMHAKRTSNRVYHLVAQRGWMAANDAEELVIDTEETTFIKILEEASLKELDHLIAFMCDQQLLTPSIVLRAACGGDLELVERALAYLASVPIKRVRALASGRGLRTLLGKAGMPQTSIMLMRAVFDVAAYARTRNQDLSSEEFGSKVVEFIMTRYETVTSGGKSSMLDMIAKFSTGRTKRIASRVQDDLQRAA